MQYKVVGSDGNEYGPVDGDQLKQWVAENRIFPATVLIDLQTGQRFPASSMPGLLPATPPVAAPPAPFAAPQANYQRPMVDPMPQYRPQVEPSGALWGVILRCAAAIIFLFIFRTAGLITSIYAVIYAVQLKSHGSRYGPIALGLSISTLAIVGIVFFIRFSGAV